MAKAKAEAAPTERDIDDNVKLAIERRGEVIAIPQNVTLGTAAKIITSQMEYEEQTVQIDRTFENVHWADAALALHKAMQNIFLWVDAKSTFHLFFGEQPPQMVKVKSGSNGETVNVPMGKFQLAVADNAECYIRHNGIECSFAIRVKRKFEHQINQMVDLAVRLMAEESLYRHKALTFKRVEIEDRFNGCIVIDEIDFMDVTGNFTLLLNDDIERDLRANVWTLLTNKQQCNALGIPSKRSVLMYGAYGTGKTLAAHATARIAAQTGHTFTYVTNAEDLAEGYRFAINMAPSVLFVEDIDRNIDDEDYLAELSCVLDGINTKTSDVILIATTNHVNKIPPILLRPGRIDASIEVGTPNADTVRRLIAHYAPTVEGDTEAAAEQLAGNIPAVIREACERAKLFALANNRNNLDGADILDAAKSMGRQMALLREATEPKRAPTTGEALHTAIYQAVKQEPNGEYNRVGAP